MGAGDVEDDGGMEGDGDRGAGEVPRGVVMGPAGKRGRVRASVRLRAALVTQVVVADHLLCGLGSMKWLRGERGSGGMRERRALFVATPPSLYVVRSVQLSNLVLYEAESTYKVLQVHICRTVVVRKPASEAYLHSPHHYTTDEQRQRTLRELETALATCIWFRNNRISRDRPVGDQGQSLSNCTKNSLEMLSPVLAVPLLAVPSDVRPRP